MHSTFFLWNLLVIFIVSLIAGHLIVTHDRDETLAEFFRMPAYFWSVGYSGFIAMVLLFCIYGVSYRRYTKYGGKGLTRALIREQLKYGVVMVIMIEFVAATLLFYIMGHWILDTAYFKKLFGPIVLFILFANVCYVLFFLNRAPLVKVRYQFLDNKVRKSDADDVEKLDGPAMLYVEEGKIWSTNFKGEKSRWPLPTLKKSWERLGKKHYFRVGRDWIVHRNIVISVEVLPGKRLCITCELNGKFELEVSRRCVAQFKKWID